MGNFLFFDLKPPKVHSGVHLRMHVLRVKGNPSGRLLEEGKCKKTTTPKHKIMGQTNKLEIRTAGKL